MSSGKYRDLLRSFGFQSFLWTQFLGAFNDNVFKIALSLVAVSLASKDRGGGYVSLVGAVFILPFLIFSGYAGYAADAFNKRKVLIVTKSAEIAAALMGLAAFWSGRIELMLATLFLMATHSAFFGPAKYGIVPEMLPDKDLSRANGILEMSTFFAIIVGSSAGTLLYSAWRGRLVYIGIFMLAVALAGSLASLGITRVPGPAPGRGKGFSATPWAEISLGFKSLLKRRLLLGAVAASAYFWFLGSLLQMDILLLGKEVMGLPDLWIGILITFLAVGIGLGSIAAGRLSGDKVELGLVPLGSAGMGVFAILLSFSARSYAMTAICMMLLGFFGGFFIVPLNALLQQKSGSEEKGRILATNNFVSTVGILFASAALWLLKDVFHVPADSIILIFGVVTLVYTVFVMKALPAFLVRFALWMLTHTLYRIRIEGQENVPFRGPALLVCNHMSFIDGLLVGASVQRFIRFMVFRDFFNVRLIGWFLRLMKAIPVQETGRAGLLRSIEAAREELKAGHVVCIFAEGMITRTGNILPFRRGFERIVEGLDVKIIPVHLDRVWGSVFSFKGGRFFWKRPSEFPYPVTVSFGRAMPREASALDVRHAVMELASDAFEHRRAEDDLLTFRFIKNAKRRYFSICMADSTGRELTWGGALAGSLLLSGWLIKNRPDEKMTGVLLPSSVAGALANAAVLFSGGAPVNLNYTAGAECVSSAVKECGIRTIITTRALLAKASIKETAEMVFIEDIATSFGPFSRALAGAMAFCLPSRSLFALRCRGGRDARSVATVIFTSGSTGEPKGVLLTHHNIISNIEGFTQVFPLRPDDVVLGSLPFFHSLGFTGTVWLPLVAGFKAAYHPNPLDAAGVGALAKKHGATLLVGTPAFYSAYAKKCRADAFSTVRYAICGAEKLRRSIAAEFREKFGIELLEGYGCSELSPVVSVNTPDVEDNGIAQRGNISGTVGHPLPGVSIRVVDPESRQPLPPGREGLLIVRGPNVMAGYLNRPAETARVVKDGWYETGDMAVVGEDGFIRITDRMARFSKIGGEMIPHIRIEEAISRLLGCDSAVTSLPDEARGERLFAFYNRKDTPPSAVWERLKQDGLPLLWIPRRDNIRMIDSIPAGPTGKVDLRALKALAEEICGKGKPGAAEGSGS